MYDPKTQMVHATQFLSLNVNDYWYTVIGCDDPHKEERGDMMMVVVYSEDRVKNVGCGT